MLYIADYHDNLVKLPEPQRKIKDIAVQLSQGISIIWFFPENIEADLYCQCVINLCGSNGMQCQRINVLNWEEEDQNNLPIDILSESYDLNLQDLMISGLLAEELPEISLIYGIPELEKQNQIAWCHLINEWAYECKKKQASLDFYNPPALLIPLNNPELIEHIITDVFLDIGWFWGWFSQVELRLIARSYCIEAGYTIEDSLWVQYALVELAGNDPFLLEWLIANASVSMSIAETFDCLREYALNYGWNEDEIKKMYNTKHNSTSMNSAVQSLYPPKNLSEPWQKGIANYSHEEGIRFNSAVFAILGSNHIIEQRLWSGQAKILLPLLDEARRNCCNFLIHQFKDWPNYIKSEMNKDGPNYTKSEINKEDMEAIELGFAEFWIIEKFLNSKPMHRKTADCIRELRLKRNKLAHYKALSGNEFCYVLDQVESLRKDINF